MAHPEVKETSPFLQGFDEGRWAMVEFLKGGEAPARIAAEYIAQHFATPLLEGDFTRAELGL